MPTINLGRYQILSELGQGAMGVVYKAIDPLIERTVAIKTIKLDLSTDELANFEERFYREAKSAGCLNHPNIVTIYDIGKTDNVAYMAMEFMEGRLLKDVLDTHTPLSMEHIIDIATQIADGLAYAHENGIVHRDIKPANIMLLRGDVVKIMDFGIARMSRGAQTLGGGVIGSPKYMAPEQIAGKMIDGRADIFALGVILYEMLTGESPFDGDNINTIMYRIVNESPILPKTLVPSISPVFDNIIITALAKSPEDRYQTARELANDLKNQKKVATAPVEIPIKSTWRSRTPSVGEETIILDTSTKNPQFNDPSKQDSSSAATAYAYFANKKKLTVFKLVGLTFALIILAIFVRKPTLAPKPSLTSNTPQRPAISNSHLNERTAPVIIKPETAAPPAMPASVISPATPSISNEAETSKPQNAIKGKATVTFAVFPWGEIYIDGQKAGVTPPVKKLTIPAGKHKIVIRNLNFPYYSATIVLKPGSKRHIKYTFHKG